MRSWGTQQLKCVKAPGVVSVQDNRLRSASPFQGVGWTLLIDWRVVAFRLKGELNYNRGIRRDFCFLSLFASIEKSQNQLYKAPGPES